MDQLGDNGGNICPLALNLNQNKEISCSTQKWTVFIPTLEGDEAEEFIRKAESAERATVDWSKQMKQMELALKKSRIANRKWKYTKSEALKVKRSKDVEP
jgi:predicted nucleic acid-binding protein